MNLVIFELIKNNMQTALEQEEHPSKAKFHHIFLFAMHHLITVNKMALDFRCKLYLLFSKEDSAMYELCQML